MAGGRAVGPTVGLEREGGLDAAGVLLDQVAEAALVIEPERGAFDADHVDAGPDIGQHVVGCAGDAERAYPSGVPSKLASRTKSGSS